MNTLNSLNIMEKLINDANRSTTLSICNEISKKYPFIYHEFRTTSNSVTLFVWFGEYLEFMKAYAFSLVNNNEELIIKIKNTLAFEYLNTKMLLKSEIQGLFEAGKIDFPQHVGRPKRPKNSYEHVTINKNFINEKRV